MEAASHIIGKQRIHLHYKGVTDTIALRQMISKVCSDELPARLSKLLDRYDDKDFVFRIDKLDVHVTVDDDGHLEDTLAKLIIEQIEVALRQKLEQRVRQILPIDQSFARTLQFYLENGFLPWWSLLKDRTSFQQALQQAWRQPDSLQKIVHEILPGLASVHARNRLIYLLTNEQLSSLIAASYVWDSENWANWQECFSYIQKELAGHFTQYDLEYLLNDATLSVVAARPPESVATAWLAELISKKLAARKFRLPEAMVASLPSAAIRLAFISHSAEQLKRELPRPKHDGMIIEEMPQALNEKQADDIAKPQEEESIFISNAGLVLIASYLPAFFRNMGLLQDGHLKEKGRATAFLREMTFAQNSFEEFEIVLEKILCGIPLAESVEARYSLTQEEKKQTDLLLQSVIEHWSVLKRTSPEGLRNSFLQREGKMTYQRNQWELTVQKQAHDMLLDYIPWNFRMIKLPWMPELLTVHWNN